MSGEEFLTYAGHQYLTNKKKWSYRLSKMGLKFSEDIYNDTILKVYNHIQNGYDGDIESYWYKSFVLNTKRECEYAYHKRDDSVDILQYLDNFPTDDKPILLQDIQDILKDHNNKIDFHLMVLYYLTDLTFKEIEDLTEVKDARYKVRGIIKLVKDKIKERGLIK